MNDRWAGLNAKAASLIGQRDYARPSPAERLATSGVEAREIIDARGTDPLLAEAWIPGVEVFARTIYPQRHRGFFGELAREEEGPLAAIGMWPKQWATARMFAGTAKGFHIHPPHIPEGESPEEWFRKLFVADPSNYSQRLYDLEQWDVMFMIQGNGEMLLVDERAGMPRKIMRFIIEGDDQRGPNNVGVVIPPGVAHAIRAEAANDFVMVYGTSTKFDPANEGRIAAGVESAPLPEDWQGYLSGQG
jgi:dTDP-4-dehydrorhamnose 3,5-epimerase-like enzyme